MPLTEEDQELTAKAIWMTAYEGSLKACREIGLSPEATLTGMITTMTSVVRMLFEDIRKEED